MWTANNRGRYDRSKWRYPSDLTDEEWTHVEPVIPPAKDGGRRRRIGRWCPVRNLRFLTEFRLQRPPLWPRAALAQCAIVEQPRSFIALRPSRHLALVIAIAASAPLRRHPDACASSADR